MTKRLFFASIIAAGLAPLLALAANVTVPWGETASLVLPSDSSQYTLVGGSNFDQVDISDGTFTFTMTGPNEYVYLQSADKKNLSNSLNISTTCGSSNSSVQLLFETSDTKTVTVTPTGTCSSTTGTGGGGSPSLGSSGGSSGGTGGGTSAPTVIAPVAVAVAPSAPAAALTPPVAAPTAGGAVSAVFAANLVPGSRGDDVTRLQQLLKQDPSIYPKGLVTGYYGPATRAAVIKFQEKYGLPAVGKVGPATRAKLQEVFGKATPAAPSVAQPSAAAQAVSPVFNKDLSLGSRGDDVTRLQELLKQDSSVYPEGLITGYFGPATQAAVKKFQAKYGVSAIGRVGPATRAKLREVFGK